MKEVQPDAGALDKLRQFVTRSGLPSSLLWVGAGASAAAGYPTLSGLAKALRKEISEPPEDDYAVVDAYIKQYSRGDLTAKLHSLFGKPLPFAPLHEAIAALAGAHVFSWIVTTNYDRLIEDALTSAGVPFVTQALGANLALGALEQVQLHKIHGDLGDWSDVVLTTASYQAFDRDHPLVVKQLDLVLRQRPVVFVGCSMTDPRILNWLRKLTPAERGNLYASRAVLTTEEWGKLDPAMHELLESAQIHPILVADHKAVSTLLSDLAAVQAPPARKSRPIHFWIACGTIVLLLAAGTFSREWLKRQLCTYRPVTLRADKDADVNDLLRDLAAQVGAFPAIDASLRGPMARVGLSATRARLRDVLDQICDAYECSWSLDPGNPYTLVVTHKKLPT